MPAPDEYGQPTRGEPLYPADMAPSVEASDDRPGEAAPTTRPLAHPLAADPGLAAEEGASTLVVRSVHGVDERWPALGRRLAFGAAVHGRYSRHRGAVLAGGLAFFGLLSLVPSVLSLGALVALVLDPAEFAADLRTLLGTNPELAQALEPFIAQIASLSETDVGTIGAAGLISLGLSLYAASRFVYVGSRVLDIAFELEPAPPSFLARGVAVLVTLLAQLALVLAVGVLTVVPRLFEALGMGQAYSNNLSQVRLVASAVVVYLLLTVAMRTGTTLRGAVPWLNWGAAAGALIILAGSLGLSWYLSISVTYSQIVAVLGGVIALELWLYVIGIAIVLSAEIEAIRLGFRRALPRPLPDGS